MRSAFVCAHGLFFFFLRDFLLRFNCFNRFFCVFNFRCLNAFRFNLRFTFNLLFDCTLLLFKTTTSELCTHRFFRLLVDLVEEHRD